MSHVLTKQFNPELRCDRCDIILSASKYNGIPIAVNIKTNRTKKGKAFKCIQCEIKCYNRNHVYAISEDEIRNFLKIKSVIYA